MLKMLLNPMGSIVMTNDGNTILREITVDHPAAKFMIEISRTQDEEVGDGTTSVVILAGEFMSVAQSFLEQNMHPTVIISAYRQALEDMVYFLKNNLATPVDLSNQAQVMQIIQSCIGTKILGKRYDLVAKIFILFFLSFLFFLISGEFACKLALDAVKTVYLEENGRKEIDIKKYVKIEKVPGATLEDSRVLKGVMFNKDVIHSKMRR
jgi:PREDICTED: similar to chaperonin containing TCP1, subunit 3 (gamma) isoform 1